MRYVGGPVPTTLAYCAMACALLCIASYEQGRAQRICAFAPGQEVASSTLEGKCTYRPAHKMTWIYSDPDELRRLAKTRERELKRGF